MSKKNGPTQAQGAPANPTALRLGVYLDSQRHTAIVLRSKDSSVAYLSMETGSVDLHVCSSWKFKVRFTISLPDYPITRALIKYARSGLAITDNAREALRVTLLNAKKRGML